MFVKYIVVAVMLCPGIAAAQQPCVMDACPITTQIRMDGIMDEPCWNQAAPVSTFTQIEPREGEPSTETTEVRVLYDEMNLYIGVYCRDTQPELIVHNELRFDGNLSEDDHFTVVLDTFADQRNGYLFSINPNGARQDATLGTGGLGGRMTQNNDWNGVWDTAAQIREDGWSAEIVIPFLALRFSETPVQTWGINFRRVIARKNEEVLWSAWRRDEGIAQISRAGELRNLRDIRRGDMVEIKPYLLGGLDDREGVTDRDVKYGIDVKYPLTSDLTLDFTSFTDFAQIEADRTQINLTRFDIKYPEKRDFFLEGADIFTFGSGISTPFYSRTIGLDKNRQSVPILGGAKLTGKTGKYNIGVLDMQTDSAEGVASTNYSVVRVKRDILKNSSIGMIATGLHDENGYWDRTAGVDFSFITDRFLGNKNFTITSWYEKNFKENMDSGSHTGQLTVQYPNDLVTVFFNYKEADSDYLPGMGFNQRVGLRHYRFNTQFSPRPDIPYIRQLNFAENYWVIYNKDTGVLETRDVSITPFGFTTQSEDTFSIAIANSYDLFYDPFRVFQDVVIPADSYEWWDWTASLRTNRNRPLSMTLSFGGGDFYNGTKETVNSSMAVKFSEFLVLEPQAILNRISLDNQTFDTQEYSMRVSTNISPRLSIRTFVQWNNNDEQANMNFRIHYIPRVGSDIFFVYNHILDGTQDYDTIYNAGLAKIDWRFEF